MLDLAAWVAVPPEEQIRKLKRANKTGKGRKSPKRTPKNHVDRPSDGTISPLDLYLYLKSRFGPPNELMMATRTTGTDNIIQWGYYFRSHKHDYFRIHGTSTRVEFFAVMPREKWIGLLTSIKSDFASYGKQMSAIRRSLKRWALFINPFRRAARTVNAFASQLAQIKLTEPPPRPMAMTRRDADEYNRATDTWTHDAFVAQMLATSIRMLAPVVAEAFVNFVLFVLGRPDVRKDTRVYDATIRQPIDVRVRSLHLFCDGFERPVDCSAPAFAGFQTLMNSRNDFLHGNIDPTRLTFDDVFFDSFYGGQVIPLFNDDRGMISRFVSNSFKFVEPTGAAGDWAAVNTFIEHVLSHLSESARMQTLKLLGSDFLGWDAKTGEIAELFDHPAVESLLIIPDGE